MSTDPLLRATADGDTACPDGRALAALGRSVRDASALPRPVDLVAGVMSRLEGADPRGADLDLDDDAIDAFYDGDGRGPTELVNLSGLVRAAAQVPHPVDLGERVRAQLAGSLRLSAQRAIDLGSRWRLWSTVVAGHVAALLALAVYQFHTSQPVPAGEPVTATAAAGDTGAPGQVGIPVTQTPPVDRPLPIAPAAWSQIPGTTIDLFSPRRDAASRTAARAASGMADTTASVTAGLRWVLAQQDPAGRFGAVSTGDHAVAVHSLALLALLGEGLDDAVRADAVRRGLAWLAEQQAATPLRDPAVAGLSALALVEGALLVGDPALRPVAEAALARAEAVIPAQSGPAGLGGFLLLAYATAQQGGLKVSGHGLEAARNNLGERSLPSSDVDTGRVGVALFCRLITGRADNPSVPVLSEELGRSHRLPRADPTGRIDPLGWYFGSLAAHESGGRLWSQWSDALRLAVVPALVHDGDLAHLPAASTRFAEAMGDGDLFATGAALLELQVPYRYLGVAR